MSTSLTIWLYTLISVSLISLASLVGLFTLSFKEQRLRSVLQYLVSFSAGVLLGDVFLHVFPEMVESGIEPQFLGLYILAGIIVFFALERIILWHHSHTEHEEKVHTAAYLVLFGDGLHNFIDGIIIAGSFLVDVHLGIVTSIAVLAHEIPHEIGDFGVLIHGGWSVKKALWYNFLSALTAIAGAVMVLLVADTAVPAPGILLALAAASFLYISMSDLVPELHKELNKRKSLIENYKKELKDTMNS
jgi:zinc and cadmium transporter